MLTFISYLAVILGILSALYILIDVIKNPQSMGIMNIVWPINGLYLGPLGIYAYWKIGRAKQTDHHDNVAENSDGGEMHGDKPRWQGVFVSTSHCSSGCAFGDAVGVPIVAMTGLTIAGSVLFSHYTVEFILAYLFGIFFQVFSIVPMSRKMGHEISWKKGLIKAIKADTFALIAFEVGMFGWMAIVHFYLFTEPPKPDTMTYWFMMQIAMILGTASSFPANWLLVQKGIKHSM
ncbi:DUF4396 domain-containing protein [Pseudalkalibacillus salsuginis]|uniref:DUF4396 domain-containing protein n=1 Tax=Pseudalkalibacillus salsuginis TaxID=2910972 RepID=UPI001F37D459|nr:DUF4396 domain-containing protein [Pseudalkalibacillus salsuginis]MCF6409381.1 DUF4396 domain-containing protein [Pseudalkalibacillus salsuginis]